MATRRRRPEPNLIKVDGHMVRISTVTRPGDGGAHNRTPSHEVRTGDGRPLGIVYRVDHGEPRHTGQSPDDDIVQTWWCRPPQLLGLSGDAPTIGPLPDLVSAVSALLKCTDRG
jgi:hypothetical protein